MRPWVALLLLTGEKGVVLSSAVPMQSLCSPQKQAYTSTALM